MTTSGPDRRCRPGDDPPSHRTAVAESAERLTAASAGHLAFAHAIVDGVDERFAAGEAVPEVGDAIAAAWLFTQVQAASDD